jgi:hypothetical protein
MKLKCPCRRVLGKGRKKYCSRYCMRYFCKKKWKAKNHEKVLGYSRDRYKRKREWILERERSNPKRKAHDKARKATQRKADPEGVRAKNRAWYAKNAERVRSKVYAYRERNFERLLAKRREAQCLANQEKMKQELFMVVAWSNSKLTELD